MIPRLDISFPLRRQWRYWFGAPYEAQPHEYLLNHARSGIVLALRATLPQGGRVGVVVYNCHTVANAVVEAGCTPVFVDIDEDLHIAINTIPAELDAIVVTNLFGIHNDIDAIRAKCPPAVIIVDNAHGYGLPPEGDFTVYSINQGKFPALGEGGLLKANSLESERVRALEKIYASLPSYRFVAQVKLFFSMLIKAIAYSRCMYWLTMKLKKSAKVEVHEVVTMKKMAKGVRRLYKAWLPNAEAEIAKQKRNAEKIDGAFYGDNAFMAIVKCEDPSALQKQYAARGIETATHFLHAIDWAREFGYQAGQCPTAEYMTRHLLMIPTYCKISK